jgi:ribosomal protein L17
MSDTIEQAVTELYHVQFCDNTAAEAAEARKEVEQIIRALEPELSALRDLLAAVRETRHLADHAYPKHIKAALELCEEQLRKVEA